MVSLLKNHIKNVIEFFTERQNSFISRTLKSSKIISLKTIRHPKYARPKYPELYKRRIKKYALRLAEFNHA